MKISIVIPSLNQRGFLPQTVESVLNQSGEFDLEVFVVDGGSDDGSREYLAGLSDPRLDWVSEPDQGQTDAINKGLARVARGAQIDGDVQAWLNSDDRYRPGALNYVAARFSEKPDTQWLVGRYRTIDEQGKPIEGWIERYKARQLRRFSRDRLFAQNMIGQPAVFWRTEFARRVGPLDAELRQTMDYDYWLRMSALADPDIVDQCLAEFRIHPASKTSHDMSERFRESLRVTRRHAGGRWGPIAANWWHSQKIMLAYRTLRVLGRLP